MPLVLVRCLPASAEIGIAVHIGDAASRPRRNSIAGTLALAVSALHGFAW